MTPAQITLALITCAPTRWAPIELAPTTWVPLSNSKSHYSKLVNCPNHFECLRNYHLGLKSDQLVLQLNRFANAHS